ncbi:hypothetical protein OKW35_000242 [Paraburkholderia sp. MM5477-R1]
MEEQQVHRGYIITVSAREDCDGGSTVTLLVEQMSRRGEIDRKGWQRAGAYRTAAPDRDIGGDASR